VSISIESEPTTNLVISIRHSPILKTLPETEFSSEYTIMLLCYIFGPSVVKYGILTTFQATTTLETVVLRRRANARNVSFFNLSRWQFNLYNSFYKDQIFAYDHFRRHGDYNFCTGDLIRKMVARRPLKPDFWYWYENNNLLSEVC